MDYRNKLHKCWETQGQVRGAANVREHKPAMDVKHSRYGFLPTTGATTTTEVTLRRASNQKTTRKPSMPKMPWDNQS